MSVLVNAVDPLCYSTLILDIDCLRRGRGALCISVMLDVRCRRLYRRALLDLIET